MFTIPVDVLQHWRSPDRDLYRMLALSGARSTRALIDETRLADYIIQAALRRLGRLGVVQCQVRRLANRQRHQAVWTAVPYQSSRATVIAGGTVMPHSAVQAYRPGRPRTRKAAA